eukprot:scaffold30512_cov116-Skeletonema_dohrnii-CCMP3373.AAC.1
MSASNDHNNDQAGGGSGSPLTSISATNRGPTNTTLTLPPPPAMTALSANLRLREDESSLIDSFSLHLNNYLGTDEDDDGGGDDSDDTNATDTSDVTWLTYRDEKCNEVKEEFIRRLKLESGDRVLSVEERRALLEGIVREQGRRDEVEKERRKRIVEEEEVVMSDFGGGESDGVNVEDSVDGGRRDREEDYEDEECIRRSTDSHPHPAALFDANHNFVGIGRGPSGSLPSSSGGGGGPSSSFHSSSANNHHHNSSMQPSVMRYNSSGGRIMGGLDLVKEETRSDIRAAGGSRSQHDSLTTSNHSNSQQQQQQTSMNAPPSPQHHHHYTQQINQEHINSIVNLKLLVANQQAMLDALSSKLHNAELANNILQSENKILTQNNEMIQQQLIRKTREVVEMKREVLGLETRLLQQSQQQQQQQSASSSTFAPPTTTNAISAQEQFTIRALESRMKKMDQMNKMLMQDKMQMQREMAMLKRKADDSGSSSESFIVKRVESYVKKTDSGSGGSSAAFAKVAEDESRKDVPPLLPPEGQQTSLPVAPEGSTDSSSSGGGKKKQQQQPKKHTDVISSVQDTTAASSRRSSASSSSSEPPLDFLRNKKTRNSDQLSPESLVAAPPSLAAAPPGSDTSSSRSKKKIEVIPSMQDSPEASKLSSSMEIVKNIRRTRFADQQERSSTSGSCRIQGSGKTYSDGGRESSAKGSTSGTAVVEPVRYKSQIASSNKLFGDTKLLSGLVTRLGISSRLSNRGESTMRVEDLSKELIPLVGEPKFCAMIYNVLSPEECAGLIRRAKVEQFEELSYYRRSSGVEPANISCCKRCRLSDSGLAVDLFTKISDALKGTPLEREFQRRPSVEDYDEEEGEGVADGSVLKGKRPGASVTRISEPFNVIRYDVGEFFAPHRDNTFRTGTEVSRLTLQVFLNEKFSGGVTSIRHGKKFFDIKPKMGSVLLVDQELRREECYVVSGKKYVVRADVMYDECKVDAATAVTERSAYTRDTRESGYTRETNPL